MAEGRVLVVDDERQIRDVVAEALADDGYEVETAANGAQALAVLSRWVPDLIVLDLMMPVMDGATFRVRQLALDGAAEVPVLILSASRDAEGQRAKLGALGFIHKPFDLDALLDHVGRLLAAR